MRVPPSREKNNLASGSSSSKENRNDPTEQQQSNNGHNNLIKSNNTMASRNDGVSSSMSSHANNQKTIALSQQETILLSSSGDVLISRCRASPYSSASSPYQWYDHLAMMCCETEDLERQMQDTTLLCSPGGLLGGAPTAAVSPVNHHDPRTEQTALRMRGGTSSEKKKKRMVMPRSPHSSDSSKNHNSETFKNRAQKAFNSPPLVDTGFDEESIVPIQSFDYSHFSEGGNDMLPPSNTSQRGGSSRRFPTPGAAAANSPVARPAMESSFLHGVPTFFPAFSQVKVTQVSAHPMGSHALLISNSGLLYSYGLNNYGQLGIGMKTRLRGSKGGASRGGHANQAVYIATPNIVTPLLENGGKAVSCAAGVSHSLVVVETEERRLIKSRSVNAVHNNDQSQHATEAVVYHQLYGFGRNDFMKIGLVSPKLAKAGGEDEMEHVLLPRRVSLRCKVLPKSSSTTASRSNSFGSNSSSSSNWDPPLGIFSVQAAAEHSAALVRRSSGDVELYTWGNAMHGALGLPQNASVGAEENNKKFVAAPIHVVPVPSFVAALSRSSNAAAQQGCVLLPGEIPTGVSLARKCSFVTTSEGRCFSFGVSEDGMLGLGMRIRECPTPSEIALPSDVNKEFIQSVSAGATSVVATTQSGAVLGWGTKQYIGLLGECDDPAADGGEDWEEEDAKQPDPIQWSPMRIQVRCDDDDDDDDDDGQQCRIVQACAGSDNCVFVTENGRVLSCGKASGRLGMGETDQDVLSPTEMFGGLTLWRSSRRAHAVVHHHRHHHHKATTPPALPARKPQLRRGQTVV